MRRQQDFRVCPVQILKTKHKENALFEFDFKIPVDKITNSKKRPHCGS